MQKTRFLDRREFTLEAALAALAGVAITVTGCGGGSDSPTAPSNPGPTGDGDVTGSVSANHGHTAVITAAELTAAQALSLDIQGTSDHPHSVDLTADDVARIAGGDRVTVTSSNDQAHTHDVTFG